MIRFPLLVFFFLICSAVSAQQLFSVRGTVIDATTKAPLAGVSISANNRTFLTSESGSFYLDSLSENAVLNVFFPGYAAQQVPVKNSGADLQIQLKKGKQTLPTVVVTGYQTNRNLHETAGGIGLIESQDLNRFSETSLVNAVNTLPGVRLEERAAVSYRVSIRGSTLRAPFGVRNVKVYLNGLPFTEANGNTPLNLLDAATIGRVEVLKGPAGSMYGAGTGGTLLLKTVQPEPRQTSVEVDALAGSYGLRKITATAQTASDSSHLLVQVGKQQSDGYRQQNAMDREVLYVNGKTQTSARNTVAAQLLYSRLYYELPGAITRQQFLENPRQVRPISISNRSSIDLEAVFLSLSQQYQFSESWSQSTGVYGSFSFMDHPFTLNYERNFNQGFGGRSTTTWQGNLAGLQSKFTAGGEFQKGLIGARKYENNQGQTGGLQLDDEIETTTGLVFAQTEIDLPNNFIVTAGLSLNFLKYDLTRITNNLYEGTGPAAKKYDPVLSPRLALVKQLTEQLAWHGSISNGFSTPSQPEVFTDDGAFNLNLKPERGLNYEAGFRADWWRQKLQLDVTAFYLNLDQTIVSRKESRIVGADTLEVTLYENAGTTSQKGIESALTLHLLRDKSGFVSDLKLWGNYSYHYFRFKNYQKEGQDFSGNRLTGSAPHTAAAGLDLETKIGLYLNLTSNYVSEIPLNDANTVYADAFWVTGFRTGIRRNIGTKWQTELYGGIENLTNERYSLGNDLNAFGGRYFQAAPDRNFYASLRLKYSFR